MKRLFFLFFAIFLSTLMFGTIGLANWNDVHAAIGETSADYEPKGSLHGNLKGIFRIVGDPCVEADTLGELWVSSPPAALDCETDAGRAEAIQKYSAMGQVMGLSQTMYETPPASAIAWFNYEKNKVLGNNVAFAQELDYNPSTAYRPGAGYSLLSPLQALWAWARNITYIMYIVMIIIIAFLILFRNNLGGQTPITIFNSLPSIILSLILITFSYPISAFFVDIVTLGSSLAQNLILTGPGAPGASLLEDGAGWDVQNYQIVDTGRYGSETIDLSKLQPDDAQMSVWQALSTSGIEPCTDAQDDCELADLLPQSVTNTPVFGGMAELILGGLNEFGIDSILIKVIIAFSGLMVSIKLFMLLLNKYLVLVLGPVVAPFYFFLSGFPSKTGSTIMLFLRAQLGAALTFVGVYAWFLFLIIVAQRLNISGINFLPPLLGYEAGQFFSGGSNLAGNIISFALFLATPAVPEFINTAFQVPESNAFAKHVGGRLQQGASTAGNLGMSAFQTFRTLT